LECRTLYMIWFRSEAQKFHSGSQLASPHRFYLYFGKIHQKSSRYFKIILALVCRVQNLIQL
jgi:hypothetical protein